MDKQKIFFRTRVRIKHTPTKIVRPSQQQTQTEFFQGVQGIVIRHDEETNKGYLVVIDCPEVKAAMGETITAYFYENELEIVEPPPHLADIPITEVMAQEAEKGDANYTAPDLASIAPMEYPQDDPAIVPRGVTKLSLHKKEHA